MSDQASTPQNDTGPISMAQAAAIMAGTRGGVEPEQAPAAPETRQEPAQQDARQTETPPASGDDLSPEELGATESDASGEAGSQPPLDPPASFSAEEKEAFRRAPRDVQEAVRRLEDSRRQDISRRQQEANELRTKAESSLRQLESERQYIAQQIVPLVQQMHASMQADFSDIRTPQDIVQLAISDPARHGEFQARMTALTIAQKHQDAVLQQEQAKVAEALRTHMAAEQAKLVEAMPAWKDESVRRAGIGEVKTYLSGQGFDEATIQSVADHRAVLIARKAMLYDRAMAKRADQRVGATPTATVRSGAAPTTDRVQREVQAAQERLNKSGSLEDALAIMRLPQRRN
jgi:hypothetical protein